MANMKIRTKILVFVVLPIFLADLAMTAFNCIDNYSAFKSLSEAKFIADTRLAAEQVSKENVQGVSIARAAAAGEVWFGSRSENVSYIRDLLEIFPSFAGASVGYEPNADFNDAKTERGLKNMRDAAEISEGGGIDAYGLRVNPTKVTVDEWLGRTEGGRFLAYWNRSEASDLSIEPLRDMETSMYYAGLKKKIESGDKEGYVITEPYLYNNRTLMVEYSAPIMFEGNFSGQMAFDRDLARISDLVSSLKTFPGSEIFLISSQSRIIAATKNSALRTAHIDDLYTDENGAFVMGLLRSRDGQFARDPSGAARGDLSKYGTVYRDLLRSAVEMSKSSMEAGGDRQAAYFTDPQSGKVYCVAHAVIRPGNWVMVQIAPRSELMAPAYSAIAGEMAGLGVFTLAMIAALALSGRTLSRVTKAGEVAEEIAAGRLDLEIPSSENSSDETRRLMTSMSHMVSNLRSLVSGVSHSARRLSAYSSSVDKASAEYEESIQNFCSSTGEISAAVKQITSTSAELAKTVETLYDGASKSSETAEDGRAQLSAVEKTMQTLSASTSSIAKRLAIINERANNINAVVVAISKVADETNMLSLNASIEAEKAGAYGLGFSVVAREIGRLADQTALATSDIETIVRDMQNAVAAGVSEMDKFAEDVRMGVSDVERIIGGMDTIITKMQSIAPQLESLTEGMNSQTAGVSQISEAMSSLNDGVRQAGALLRQVSDSRSQMREAMASLEAEISKFKLGERR